MSGDVGVTANAPADGSVKSRALPRGAKLLRHSDYQRVYKQGKRHFEKHMTVFYLRREEAGDVRIGITVSRALGGAVERNRMKRRLREAVRDKYLGAGSPIDVVINPKKSLLNAEFSDLLSQVGRAFQAITGMESGS